MEEFTEKEVAECLRFRAEHGCYPRHAKPEAVAMAEKLRAEAEAMADPFAEGE